METAGGPSTEESQQEGKKGKYTTKERLSAAGAVTTTPPDHDDEDAASDQRIPLSLRIVATLKLLQDTIRHPLTPVRIIMDPDTRSVSVSHDRTSTSRK